MCLHAMIFINCWADANKKMQWEVTFLPSIAHCYDFFSIGKYLHHLSQNEFPNAILSSIRNLEVLSFFEFPCDNIFFLQMLCCETRIIIPSQQKPK